MKPWNVSMEFVILAQRRYLKVVFISTVLSLKRLFILRQEYHL
jgi:hypothetical protein